MSHFSGVAFNIAEFHSDLGQEIQSNGVADADGESTTLSPEVLSRVALLHSVLPEFEALVRSVDKLYGNDHGESAFTEVFDKHFAQLRSKVGRE